MTDYTAILHTLEACYPNVKPELHFSNPYETLVATMLSAQCTDRQVNVVTPAVFRDFPDVKAMAACTPERLLPYIKSCGFRSKADNIVAACRRIMECYGGEVPQTMEELVTLPGVGRKTANVVLASAFGVPAIAVDTHVFVVSNRLGLANAKTVEETEKQLRANIPMAQWGQAHLWILHHGRDVCRARKPLCEECPLKSLCKAYGEAHA